MISYIDALIIFIVIFGIAIGFISQKRSREWVLLKGAFGKKRIDHFQKKKKRMFVFKNIDKKDFDYITEIYLSENEAFLMLSPSLASIAYASIKIPKEKMIFQRSCIMWAKKRNVYLIDELRLLLAY